MGVTSCALLILIVGRHLAYVYALEGTSHDVLLPVAVCSAPPPPEVPESLCCSCYHSSTISLPFGVNPVQVGGAYRLLYGSIPDTAVGVLHVKLRVYLLAYDRMDELTVVVAE